MQELSGLYGSYTFKNYDIILKNQKSNVVNIQRVLSWVKYYFPEGSVQWDKKLSVEQLALKMCAFCSIFYGIISLVRVRISEIYAVGSGHTTLNCAFIFTR